MALIPASASSSSFTKAKWMCSLLPHQNQRKDQWQAECSPHSARCALFRDSQHAPKVEFYSPEFSLTTALQSREVNNEPKLIIKATADSADNPLQVYQDKREVLYAP